MGTGSTANCFIDALAPNRHRFEAAVASSEATAERLRSHGIPVASLNDAGLLSIYVDGADEIDDSFNMIKGGGAALTRRKSSRLRQPPLSVLPTRLSKFSV